MASAVVQLQFYEDFLKEPHISSKPKKKTPRKTANKLKRQREYLTGEEIDALKKAARSIGRYGLRDELIISMMYHHGLRVSEAVKLQFHQVDFKTALLHVRRSKNGTPSTHPINGDDLRTTIKASKPSRLIYFFQHDGYYSNNKKGTSHYCRSW